MNMFLADSIAVTLLFLESVLRTSLFPVCSHIVSLLSYCKLHF